MVIRFNVKYLLGFLALIFFIHECHDWAHFLAGKIVCGCWGIKSFDNWTLCSDCTASAHTQVWIWFAGPLITYIIVWIAWWLMGKQRNSTEQSLGFLLLFATIPFVRILAAMAGGSDETFGLRQLFQHADKSNSHTVALGGLILIILLTALPLLRAFILLRGWTQRILLFPLFLILPIYIDKWTYVGLNKLAATGFLENESFPGVPMLVLAWSFLLMVILLSTYKSLLYFLEPKRQKF
ncbi:MAG: hypothetical protein JST75_02930 [Bacteroidetes bacterium]|nr:hypothetical protein [Bacteroidota bacterium]